MDKEKELGKLYKELAALRPSDDFEPEVEDYEKAVKVCNKILNLDNNDSTAFHCKVVALMQAGKFPEVLKQLDQNRHQLDLQFETAYCHYRLNDPTKALAILDGIQNPQVKHHDLRAQVLYRLEQYDQCYTVYEDLIKSTDDKYDMERMTNLSAVTANLADKSRMVTDCKDTFEQKYNAGCNLAAVGELAKAESVLKEADKDARRFLEEEGEEDVDEETGIIRVQLGYVMQRLGREKEASTIYNQVLKTKPSDIGLVAVASNNLLCLNRDQNIFDSKKRLKAATVEGLELKLTSAQRGEIARNSALLAMFTAQVDLCKQLVAELEPKPADSTLIVAAALARAGKHDEAVKELMSGGGKDPVTVMTAAQILLHAGEVSQATTMLCSLPPDWQYRLGLLSALISLYLALERRPEAAELLRKAAQWHRKAGTGNTAGMVQVWRQTAEFHLRSGEAKVAAESLQELHKLEPSLTVLAQLVIAYSKYDLVKALETSKLLPPFKPSPNLDVDSLEAASWSGRQFKAVGKTPKPAGEKTPKAGEKEEGLLLKKKAIKKRKKRLPKNYNPNADPDPERWLPKKERTGLKYMLGVRKPRKDKRKAEKFTGAQGTDVGKSETFDYSGKLGQSRETAAKQASPVAETPVTGPRAQAKVQKNANKGKKKGGKKQF